ncbi:hypothetical protein BDR26DRAFT_862145 [Obelidium mucronatum]|nr:hypothetical protein BDR26DRAFT_862145 [Obelidium mucronatum]
MQRPSTRLMNEYNLITVFKEAGIKSIFNLQIANEHSNCGDGIDPRCGSSGFSYVPEDWMNEGISHYGFGWADMDVPEKSYMLQIVQVMAHDLDILNGKVAVHCHAGLGRTGLTIACYLVYAQNKTPHEAIRFVRHARPKSVQTAKQQAFVHQFKDYLITLNAIYPITISRPFFSPHKDPEIRISEDQEISSSYATMDSVSIASSSLVATPIKIVNIIVKPITFHEMMENQRLFLHGMELRSLWNVPKIVHVLTKQLKSILLSSSSLSLSNHLESSNYMCQRISSFQYNSKIDSDMLNLMREINFGNWSVVKNPHSEEISTQQKENLSGGGVATCWEELEEEMEMETGYHLNKTRRNSLNLGQISLLIDLLLFWISQLKDPFLSDKLVHAIIRICESDPLPTIHKALSAVEVLDKQVYWTLNVFMDMYRHLSPETATTESLHRIATLLTSHRKSNIPTVVQANGALLPRISNTAHKHSTPANDFESTERPRTESENANALPKLTRKPEDTGRKRVASEPPPLLSSAAAPLAHKAPGNKGFDLFSGLISGNHLSPSSVWGITRFLQMIIENVEIEEETRPIFKINNK